MAASVELDADDVASLSAMTPKTILFIRSTCQTKTSRMSEGALALALGEDHAEGRRDVARLAPKVYDEVPVRKCGRTDAGRGGIEKPPSVVVVRKPALVGPPVRLIQQHDVSSGTAQKHLYQVLRPPL